MSPSDSGTSPGTSTCMFRTSTGSASFLTSSSRLSSPSTTGASAYACTNSRLCSSKCSNPPTRLTAYSMRGGSPGALPSRFTPHRCRYPTANSSADIACMFTMRPPLLPQFHVPQRQLQPRIHPCLVENHLEIVLHHVVRRPHHL